MDFKICLLACINVLLIWTTKTEAESSSVLFPAVSNTNPNVDINRYFLQIDNIFDYKTEEIMRESPNDWFYNTVDQEWIIQPLDHFNPLEEQTFWQKYFHIGSEFCLDEGSKCPVCVFIGGDAAIHPWWLKHTVLARQCLTDLNGQVFLLEHRFYGDSAPINSTKMENLKYLTVSQALEDVASFILFIRQLHRLDKNAKIFVFGASYGGTLASLFRRKYPHLAFAAIALSAPMIREYQDKDYFPSLGKKIRKTDIFCYKQIELGLRQVSRLMENHICSKQEYPLCTKIRANFGLCSSLKGMTKLERRVFFSTFIKDLAFLIEYDGVLNVTLGEVCDVISNLDIAERSPMEKLLAGDAVISQELFRSKSRAGLSRDGECLHSKKQILCEYLKNDDDQSAVVVSGKRQRLWQKCTELGSFRTSNGDLKQHPFGSTDVLPNFHQDFCKCAFGERFSQGFTLDRLRKFHQSFGTFSPNSVVQGAGGSRIIYTIGEDDPVLRRELRMVERLGAKVRTGSGNIIFKIKATAHCGEVFLKFSDEWKQRNRGKHVSVVHLDILTQLLEWAQL